MPSDELVKEYHRLLTARGLSLSTTTREQYIEIISTEQAAAQARFSDLPALSSSSLEQAASDLARFGGTWNYRIQQLVPRVLQATRLCLMDLSQPSEVTLNMPTEETLFFGEYPTTLFNAQVRPARGGYLVLINTGLPEFVSHMSEALSQARPGHGDSPFSNERLTGTVRLVTALARKYVTRSSFVYLKENTGLRNDLNMFDRFANRVVLQGVLTFVVAHEIAHVILKHCNPGDGWISFEMPRAGTQMSPEWKMEFSADSLALRILERWCVLEVEAQKLSDNASETLIAHTLFAPFFFFECERFVSAYTGGEKAEKHGEHPPSLLRQRCLITAINSRSDAHRSLMASTRLYRRFLRRVRALMCEMKVAGTLEAAIDTEQGDVEDLKSLLVRLARENGFPFPGDDE